MRDSRVAVIDIGTNSILLLVAEKAPGGRLRPVADFSEITRLGEGIDSSGTLAPPAVQRSLEAVRGFAERARELRADRIRAIGTSALRDASNAADFTAPAQEIIGTPVQVVSGEEEARLSWLSVVTDDSLHLTPPVAVADVGGGSTEIIRGDEASPFCAQSIDIGAVRLTERYLTGDPPDAESVERARSAAEGSLRSRIGDIRAAGMAGIGGTIVNIARILRGTGDHTAVHGSIVSRREISDLIGRLAGMTLTARREVPGLEAKRADVIVGGAIVFEALLGILGHESITVSIRGARFGLAGEILREQSS